MREISMIIVCALSIGVFIWALYELWKVINE